MSAHPIPSTLLRLQATVGNRAVQSVLAVQRYSEFEDAEAGRLLLSEGNRFFKPADRPRELWAKPEEISKAQETMAHRRGMLGVEAGEESKLSASYRRVVVNQRADTPASAAARPGSRSAGERAAEPFALILDRLAAHKRTNLGQLIQQIPTWRASSPFAPNSYAEGAFVGILNQVGLQANRLLGPSDEHRAALKTPELEAYLRKWQASVSNVNDEEEHKFHFMVTECGGFSTLVMPGSADVTQAEATTGSRMKVTQLSSIPGPWQIHYAAVIMTDGADRATIESAAGMDEWWFAMYGNTNLGQTFIVKTLLSKLQLGADRGDSEDALSLEAKSYLEAVVTGSPRAAELGGPPLTPKLKASIDKLVEAARTTSDPSTVVAPVVAPGQSLAQAAEAQRTSLWMLQQKIRSTLLVPKLSPEEERLLTTFTDKAEEHVRREKEALTASSAGDLPELIRSIIQRRSEAWRKIKGLENLFTSTQEKKLRQDEQRWIIHNTAAQQSFKTRIRLATEFVEKFADTAWAASQVAGPAPSDPGRSRSRAARLPDDAT